ncbi:MAG TPA: spherulation-specific family 4 protein [Bryobacteraceae bacterium]|jgi:hypothetical protein|nr:spherulation-specific family 4 protein [Bryobacteraceae bacterium]
MFHFSGRLASIGIAAAALLSLPLVGPASSVGIIVPAYFYPGTGGPNGVGDGWADMAAAASKASITAILNPNSGPVPGPPDPNYVAAMTGLEQAGGKVIAYVDTGYTSIPLSTVEANVSTYISQYGKLINGIFFDDVNLLPGTLAYYTSLNSYVKGLNPAYLVASNPGQPFLNGVAPAAYLSTADVIDIFEGPNTAPPGQAGFNNYPYGLNWFLSYGRSHFENIVFDVPAASEMISDLRRAEQLNAGQIYITDQGANNGNPYGQLPSYWQEEVNAVASPVAEPFSSGMLLLGGAAALSCGRLKKRRAG